MAKWGCEICGYIYDESLGEIDLGIKPNTVFDDLPDDFECPECGVGKDQFTKE